MKLISALPTSNTVQFLNLKELVQKGVHVYTCSIPCVSKQLKKHALQCYFHIWPGWLKIATLCSSELALGKNEHNLLMLACLWVHLPGIRERLVLLAWENLPTPTWYLMWVVNTTNMISLRICLLNTNLMNLQWLQVWAQIHSPPKRT